MSPQQGDSADTIRLQLGDGRQIPFRLEPETRQLYYGGARRDDASELAERAELAGLIALQPDPVGPIREPETAEDGKVYHEGAALYAGMQEAREAGADEWDVVEKAVGADRAVLGDAGSDALQAAVRMEAVEDILKRYHPEFDGRSRGERIELLRLGARRMDEAWRAIDAFVEFVHGGRTDGRATRKPPDPQLDLRAAELKDALGFTHRQIGEILLVPRTETDVNQGGQRNIGRMVERGQQLLKNALGEAGYSAHIEAVKPDLLRRHSLSGRDRLVLRMMELTAGLTGRTADEAEVLRGDIEWLADKHFPED